MIGIHRRKIIYLPVLVVSVIGALVGATFDLRVLVYLRDWVGVLALVVVVMTFIWVNYLAVKGNREARFFVFEALILGVGAITGILATLGLMRDYQLMMPCAVVSSSAVAVYFIVRHSGLANRYATLVKSSGDGIVVIDRGGRIREANLAAKTMLGGQLGLFKDLLRSSDHDLFHEHVFGSRLGRREEFRLLDETDGTVVESISVKLTDGTTLLSLRDIRERMELELGMAQAARIEATELVVIELARDLRECVASIYGSAETIKQACNKGKAKDRFKKFLDVLRRCSDLGDQLSMLASGVGVEPQEFLIDNALSDLLDSLSEGLGDKISVVPQLGASGVLVRGVVQEIESVFVNLIFNSRDAMGEDGGTVWVDSAVRAGFVEISFEDDGPGIPDELWSRVWEPFFSTKEAGQGGGVGLSVVARVLRRHRGNYRVEYGGRAGGARIVVSLPVVSRVS
jgi:signal transduction histidine kinase